MKNELNRSASDIVEKPNALKIHLLGTFRIERAEVPLHLPRRKVEGLLAYLLLHPEEQSRDALATLFWGESSDDKARHSLRTALATLRQNLGEALLIANRESVQINPGFPLWVDLHHLLAIGKELNSLNLNQAGWLDGTLALWQAELLEGFYEDWVTAEREHYRARLIKLFLKITHALRSQSEYSQASKVAQHLLRFEPANEAAHQHLMFCYMALGNRAAALRQYELCEQALLEDVDAPPLAETTALYQWIKQQGGGDSSTAARITNLPIPLTSFVGRTQQLSEVKHLLNPETTRTRLLTLTGAGGSGKTRLSIQVATDLIDRFADGIWWVELAALSEGEQIARAIAISLGVSEVRNESALQSITNFFRDKQLLLVLDNCEHLVETAAQIVTELLSRCPDLQIMTTSRESLNVPGEVLWQVPALDIPDPQEIVLTDLLLQHECIRLFYERAVAVQPQFRLTLENAAAVVDICARLDGIPLAIELAAARVKVLPVEQIASRLASAIGARFDLLSQSSRTVQPRQQTLRAAIDWSYDLLDEEERQLFRTLAVFRGGFTLEALEWISDFGFRNAESSPHNSQLAIRNSLDLLTQLVDKSLVIVEPQGGENRYRMLETLREYALEQFATVEELKVVQLQHAAYFLQLAESAEPELSGVRQQLSLNRLEGEHPNLRAALECLLSEHGNEDALRLASALHRFWDIRGYLGEGRLWLARALKQRPSVAANVQAKALGAAGFLAIRQSDYVAARPLLEESLSIFEQAQKQIGLPEALQNLAIVEMSQGDYASAQKYLEQSLSLSRERSYDYGIARALNILGNLAWDQEQLEDAYNHYRESLRLFQTLGDQVMIATGLLNSGSLELQMGNFANARTNFEACLSLSRQLHNKWLTGMALKCLGWVAFDQQEYPQARGYGEEALKVLKEIDDKVNVAQVLSALGETERKLGAKEKAFAYHCQNLQLMHALGHQRGTFFALNDVARLLVEVQQHAESTVRVLAVAERLRQENGLATPADGQSALEKQLTYLRGQLGETEFEWLWQQGGSTSLPQLVAELSAIVLLTAK